MSIANLEQLKRRYSTATRWTLDNGYPPPVMLAEIAGFYRHEAVKEAIAAQPIKFFHAPKKAS